MITEWKLFNFKSVRQETKLDFGPLTILAGANSSGKSTVIQSILLVSQTLASKVPTRSVLLNGPLVKLGQFTDVLSQGSESDQISIRFQCTGTDTQRLGKGIAPLRGEQYAVHPELGQISQVGCEFAFDVKGEEKRAEIAQLHPELFSATLTSSFSNSESEDQSIKVNISRRPTDFFDQQLKSEDLDYSSLRYEIKLSDNLIQYIKRSYSSALPIGVTINNFLPEILSIKYNVTKENVRILYSALVEGGRPYFGVKYRFYEKINIPNEVIELLIERLGEKGKFLLDIQKKYIDLFDNKSSIPLEDVLESIGKMKPHERIEIRRKLDYEKFFGELSKTYLSSVEDRHAVLKIRVPEQIRATITFIQTCLTKKVKYLGPLRDEPKALYPLATSVDPSDVGLKGEYTAAVLNLYQNIQIKYIPSSAFRQPEVKRQTTNRTLLTAIIDWLKYLGVADEVQVVDKGKLGHELLILPDHMGKAIDLTHVGVGVSQVLPILVSCLLADIDTTLIFEQPELHLHPKVQTLLGDFFLSMALLKKQCILETHSEYLINRLRYRAAAAEGSDNLAHIIKMYFVERTEGASKFRDVVVNNYGAILDWPEGFFDQSQREVEEIIRFGMLKKQKERKGNKSNG